MPDGPLVSVVIPTCNRADLLTRAIQSARQQTYGNLEIIVVDDASTDKTGNMIENIADPRIRYFRHDVNQGGSAARNTGIRAARGDFIAFLDDDDEWAAEKTKAQLEFLSEHDAVMCTWDQSLGDLSKLELKKTVDLEDLRQGKFTAGGTGVLIAKAKVIKELMFDESLPRYQDWDLFIRVAMKYKIAYLNKPLVRYNKGSHRRITNVGMNMPVSELERRCRMLLKHREFFGDRWFKRHICRALLQNIKNRSNRIELLRYVVQQYGLICVVRALVARARSAFRNVIGKI